MSTEHSRGLLRRLLLLSCPVESREKLQIIPGFEQRPWSSLQRRVSLSLQMWSGHYGHRFSCISGRPWWPVGTTAHNVWLLWLLTMGSWKPWLLAVESQLLLAVVHIVNYGLELVHAGCVLEKHRLGAFSIRAFDTNQVGAIVLHWGPCSVWWAEEGLGGRKETVMRMESLNINMEIRNIFYLN